MTGSGGNLWLVFFHVLSLAVALGGLVFLAVILSPIAQGALPPADYQKLLAKIIRRFHPLLLLCYGALIMTGAWLVTGRKIQAGVNYFQSFGQLLGLKLILVFVSIMIACYQFFGLGTVIVAMVEGEAAPENLPAKLNRLRLTSVLNALVLLIILYMGLALSRT